MENKRQSWLDIARGACILCVVFFHTIIPAMREQALWFSLHDALFQFSIPAFFFVSGCAFALQRARPSFSLARMARSRALRLLVPYLTMSLGMYLLVWGVNAFLPALITRAGGASSLDLTARPFGRMLWEILTVRDNLFNLGWFLIALFILSLVNALLPKWTLHPLGLLAAFALYLIGGTLVLDGLLHRLCTYQLFFALGRLLIAADPAPKPTRYGPWLALGAFAAAVAAYLAFNSVRADDLWGMDTARLAACSVALTGILFLLAAAQALGGRGRWLEYLGKRSMEIFLFHQFIVRILASFLYGRLPDALLCLLAGAAGLFLPIAIGEGILRRSR
ncbi:MAG: acyltransferase, partial [Clostridia bacterium]|nr:acyltransferase [Clostridia bacterium]